MTTTGSTSPAPPPWRWASLAVVGICLALGGVSALETRHMSVTHGFPIPWSEVLIATQPRWWLLAVTLPFVLWFAIRTPLRPLRARVVLRHSALFLLIAMAHAVVTAWMQGFTSPVAVLFPWSARILRASYGSAPTVVALYAAVLAVAWAMSETRERVRRTVRASQLEAQLQASRLATLRARLQPHFLYNTLNAIAALADGDHPKRAVAAIEQLGELLHASLRDDAREEITIREEVALAARYLALQQMRFGARLRYRLEVAPEAADTLVPILLLQPLVENAVLHGLEEGREELTVTISAASAGVTVTLRVENDGPEFGAGDGHEGHGVGLAATRARLLTAYGDRGSLRLQPRPGGGVVVRVEIPHRRARGTSAEPSAAAVVTP